MHIEKDTISHAKLSELLDKGYTYNLHSCQFQGSFNDEEDDSEDCSNCPGALSPDGMGCGWNNGTNLISLELVDPIPQKSNDKLVITPFF